MKRNIVLFGILAIAIFFIFQSCKKDKLSEFEPTENFQQAGMQDYDEFGPSLEQAVDKSLKDKDFKTALIKLTQERRMGDFEVLMTSFLNHKAENGTQIKDILLENADGLFDEKQLDTFLENYPSLIIATRGSIQSWVMEEHSPPTVFVPAGFKETEMEIEGIKEGQAISIKLDHYFDDAVIAMHISERHDKQGNPIIIDHTPPKTASSQIARPGINMSDQTGAGLRSTCDPEPSTCTNPSIISFEVENVNGGIRLTYEIGNFPESLCQWGRVKITRIGPALPGGNGNPEIVEFLRYANDFNIFYDVNVTPNTEYVYQITAEIRYMDPDGPQYPNQDWITCSSNSMEESIIADDPLPLLNSFRGTNQNNTTLLYNWYPPQNIAANQYRLRVLTDNGYEEVPGSPIPAGTGNNYLQYNHPIEDRGNLVEMQIQYQASAGWGGDFFDRSYASFRNPGQPLYYYGARIPDPTVYELSTLGEGLLFGAPEIRLLAVRGAGTIDDRQTIIEQQTVIFMMNCVRTVDIGPFSFDIPTNYFVPNTGYPVDIKSSWDPNLEGSAITVKLTETDVSEIVITSQTNQETITVAVNAEFGYKAGVDLFGIIDVGIETSIGVQASYKSAEEIEIQYPVSDIEMDFYTIYYHNPFVLPHNSHLYGYAVNELEETPCDVLPAYLRD